MTAIVNGSCYSPRSGTLREAVLLYSPRSLADKRFHSIIRPAAD